MHKFDTGLVFVLENLCAIVKFKKLTLKHCYSGREPVSQDLQQHLGR